MINLFNRPKILSPFRRSKVHYKFVVSAKCRTEGPVWVVIQSVVDGGYWAVEMSPVGGDNVTHMAVVAAGFNNHMSVGHWFKIKVFEDPLEVLLPEVRMTRWPKALNSSRTVRVQRQ
jgi:hypothetical protein